MIRGRNIHHHDSIDARLDNFSFGIGITVVVIVIVTLQTGSISTRA